MGISALPTLRGFQTEGCSGGQSEQPAEDFPTANPISHSELLAIHADLIKHSAMVRAC